MRLPFFNADTEDKSAKHRAVWHGSERTWTRKGGTTDGVAYACQFCIVIEVTLKTGSKQFYDELTRSLEHYGKFLREGGLKPHDCYLLMVTPPSQVRKTKRIAGRLNSPIFSVWWRRGRVELGPKHDISPTAG